MSNTLCKIRDLQKALEEYSEAFEQAYGLSLKEGMLLCCIAESVRKASELATEIDLSCSNCSKVIASAEQKALVQRSLGSTDKRNMFFSLTEEGKRILKNIKENPFQIPLLLHNVIEK